MNEKNEYGYKDLQKGHFYVIDKCVLKMREDYTHNSSDPSSIPYEYCVDLNEDEVFENSTFGLSRNRYFRDATNLEILIAKRKYTETKLDAKTLLLRLKRNIDRIYKVLDDEGCGQQR